MSWYKPTDVLDKIFEASILIKGAEGLLEIVGGLTLLVVGAQSLGQFAFAVTQQELQGDPRDVFANFILHTGQHLSAGGTTFLVAYLLTHGAIKLIAVFSLMRNKLWGYPFSMVTLGLFMFYQAYQTYDHFSIYLVILTVFDVFLMWLIAREYKIQKRRLQHAVVTVARKVAESQA